MAKLSKYTAPGGGWTLYLLAAYRFTPLMYVILNHLCSIFTLCEKETFPHLPFRYDVIQIQRYYLTSAPWQWSSTVPPTSKPALVSGSQAAQYIKMASKRDVNLQ